MDLEELRKQIDVIDEELVALLNRRAEIVVQIGRLKSADGTPIYAPDREKAVLDKIRRANKGPLPDKTLLAIYRELMSGSFALEKPLRIAYLGPQGSFSHLAAVGQVRLVGRVRAGDAHPRRVRRGLARARRLRRRADRELAWTAA